MDLSNAKVGDTYILLSAHSSGPEEKTIIRVGRIYVFIERYAREVAFYKDTGLEKTDYSPAHLVDQAWLDHERERKNLWERIHIGGLEGRLGLRQNELTNEQLRKVAEALEG